MSEVWKQWEGRTVDGGFRIERFLGTSGQGAVFLARFDDPKTRWATIKLVPVNLPDADLQLAAWRRTSRLSHPHLIPIIRSGRCRADHSEFLYVATEYGDENLASVLADRPLSVEETDEVLASVLDGLIYLHREGFAHGHLKPANILAVADQLKISADGISRIGEPVRSQWRPGAYDSPEMQAQGASPAGDMWSLGLILVEALTQHLPNGKNSAVAPMIPETVPAQFRRIAADCLQIDPRQRPTAPDLADRLRPTPPKLALTPEAPPVATPGKKRYLLPAAIGLFVLVAGLVGYRFLQGPGSSPASPPGSAQRIVEPKPAPPQQTTSAPAAEPAAMSVAGQVVHKVLPDVPAKARNTIHGRVRIRVRVSVDESGKVVNSKLESPGPSRYFADRSLQAARHWEFQPPKVQGHNVASEWILHFELSNRATEVRPVPVAP
jgi:TonB family protein